MAYNNYYPQFYPSAQPQFIPQQVQNTANQQQTTNNLIWCQGEASAKSYPVSAGQSILLMDSENPVMYIKSTNQSGMPLPLRIFDYKERSKEPVEHAQTVAEPKVDYISRNEFDTFKEEIKNELKQISKPINPATKTTAKEK